MNPRSTMAASSASSTSSKRNVELQADHPCKCDMPSRVKISRTPDNPGKKFRVCQNSLSARTPRCNFWEWLEEDELGNLENEISICRKKLEEEKNSDLVFRQELDKVKSMLFTQKLHCLCYFSCMLKM
uniref:GRF-type domain-containing protein n=1 Tax=Lactuca sativa TaxID=4236 RepID=A0A9R1X8L3_LACSA|nr:hypothetical protein LSAT_V11C500289800 [Lactuca sativa]